jgi:UDP-3-O-[3-hydroxymyristoyl] glucosamine N-acyltransferase
MEITAAIIAQMVNGTIEGNPDVIIRQPAKIEEAQAGSITFLANLKYEPYLYTTKASAVLVSRDFEPKHPIKTTLIRVDNVYETVRILLEKFSEVQTPQSDDIHSMSFIDSSASIGENVVVGSFTHIDKRAKISKNVVIGSQVHISEGVEIGENTQIHSGVKIYKGCKIGNNCIILANAVIGSDGFGFVPQADGTFKKMPQVGIVIIEDNVEIGANTVIDRATMGATTIKAGAKLDNLIMVAHNVEIGYNTAIAAQAGIAGSTKVGNNCIVGGQVGIVGHISVADGSKIQAQSGISKSIKAPNQAWYGSPAFGYNNFLRSQVYFQKLPQLEKRIRELEQQLKKMNDSQ